MLHDCLADLERRIDPDTEDELWRAWREFADGRWADEIFIPRRRRRRPARLEWPAVRVNETLDDPARMALQQFGACSRSLAAGDGRLLMVRANYGTGILPTLFGAELFVMDDALNELPGVRPLAGGAEAARRLLDGGVPDLRRGLGGRTLDMGARFQELLRNYPRLSRYVKIYHPDLQSPIDVCEMLWGSSLFLDLYDEPDLVRQVLGLITATYSAFLSAWERLVPYEPPHAVHWGMLHRGRIMLRNDSAMNLSPEMYAAFIAPFERRLLDEWGGGAVHFCGRGDHFIAQCTGGGRVTAVHMSQPQYNDTDVICRYTVDAGIPLLNLKEQAVAEARAAGRPLRGRVHCWNDG